MRSKKVGGLFLQQHRQDNMSFYAQYLKERTNDEIIETKKGFLTYRFMPTGEVYIVDLYIHPDFREQGEASALADEVVAIAKQRGCTELLGSVVPSNKGSTASLKVLLAYGMNLKSSTNDFILFSKGI